MAPVAVVSDTTGYLPREVVERTGIHLVSLYVNYGERTERESDMPDFGPFYEELRGARRLPTTSQPAVGDFVSAYGPLLDAGLDIVSVHISAGISGTHNAAVQAAETLERDGRGGERIRVVDSATTAGSLGLVSLAAVRAASELEDVDAVADRTREARAEMQMWCTLDTLEYLRRGGRIGPVGAWVGSTLRIKPIITLESEVRPVERVRTAKRAFERLVDYARQRHESGADGWCVQHAQWPDQAEALVDRCREVFGTEPAFVSEVGPVLGTHAGPGMLGMAALPARYLPGPG